MENHYIDTIKKMANLFAVEIPTWNVNLNVEIKDGQEMQFKEMPTFPSRSVLGRMKNNISCNCNFNGILLFLLMVIPKTIVIIAGHKVKICYRNEP